MTMRKWTEKDSEYIRENYKEKTDKELADELGKSRQSVCERRLRMGLNKRKGGEKRKWTEKEKQYVRENYKEKTDKELAEEINRTINSICQQRLKMGLKKR